MSSDHALQVLTLLASRQTGLADVNTVILGFYIRLCNKHRAEHTKPVLFGAEVGFYQSLPTTTLARNQIIRSLEIQHPGLHDQMIDSLHAESDLIYGSVEHITSISYYVRVFDAKTLFMSATGCIHSGSVYVVSQTHRIDIDLLEY